MQIAVNGIELHWETAGEGEPLLWLHGFMGCGADWRHVFGEPPAGWQLIAPDLRGHGASSGLSGPYSFEASARDVLALLDYLHLGTVKVIGISGGGITALHMATMRPSRIPAMAAVSAPPSFPEQARAIQRSYSESVLPDTELARLRQIHARPGQLDALFAQARSFADSHDPNFTAVQLSAITGRTLIVFGDRDPFYPVSLAVGLYQAIPDAYLWVVPGGGHAPVFGDEAPAFAARALAFLGGKPEKAGG